MVLISCLNQVRSGQCLTCIFRANCCSTCLSVPLSGTGKKEGRGKALVATREYKSTEPVTTIAQADTLPVSYIPLSNEMGFS